MPRAYLTATPVTEGVRFALERRGLLSRAQAVPRQAWADVGEPTVALALGRLRAWLDDDIACEAGDGILVRHEPIAALGDLEAARLGLPPPPDFALHVQAHGTIDQPDFRVTYGWRSVGGQPVLGITRIGCWLRRGQRGYRLPDHLYGLVEAIDAFGRLPEGDEGARWRAWTKIRELLPDQPTNDLRPDPYLNNIVIAHAAAFSIRPKLGRHGFDFDPVVFGPKPRPVIEADEPAEPTFEAAALLPPQLQQVFAEQRFRQTETCRPRYTLENGYYLVLDPEVQAALDVARKAQLSDRQTRKAFARNPRAFLREALGDRSSEEALEQLFVETVEFSERVRELGLWQPPVLPWVQRQGGDWLPEDRDTWPKGGLVLADGRGIDIPPEDIEPLRSAMLEAMSQDRMTVDYGGVQIPATAETIEALGQLPGAERRDDGKPKEIQEETQRGRQVLLIEDNFDSLGFERRLTPRKVHDVDAEPDSIRTAPKVHQREGLAWLKEAWRVGEPGTLLADDMGLGKTLQALAFLDWVRRIQARVGRCLPFLVVAPTSLLDNWAEEHARHLREPGLGEPLRLASATIRRLRRRDGVEVKLGEPVLDVDRLAREPWILTTYETLRDYHLSLASQRFAVAVFDEVQKIKNPGSLATIACKAINADFVLALTGTPIENRLADLWSIADRVHEGLLGDLKRFSRHYEPQNVPRETLQELKTRISEPREARPPFMLRRMKEDQLDGLPEKRVDVRSLEMPRVQVEAYRNAVAIAQGGQKGDMLMALQRLRATSLHPLSPGEAYDDPDAFVYASARWILAFAVLKEIAQRGEKALVFLEIQALQPVLAAIVQRRFGLAELPKIINGSVAGHKRQGHVTAFQNRPKGFDLLILGPRAAGVGLTLTAANHVIHLSRWWNPAVEDQCTDRVYRIGQTKPVTVHLPQALFPDAPERSFDTQLHRLLERKRALSRELLAAPAGTDADVEDLYRSTIGDPTN